MLLIQFYIVANRLYTLFKNSTTDTLIPITHQNEDRCLVQYFFAGMCNGQVSRIMLPAVQS